jgi:hypothetical protein
MATPDAQKRSQWWSPKFWRDRSVATIPDGTVATWNGDEKRVEFRANEIPAPVRTVKSDANLVMAANTPNWTDLDPGGTAAARPLDVVIPDVEAGQWVEFTPSAYVATATGATSLLDVFTIVGGAPVHQFGSTEVGISAWFISAGVPVNLGTRVSYQVQADDIEDGSVRLRLRFKNLHASTTRNLGAGSGNRVVLEGRGPFGDAD